MHTKSTCTKASIQENQMKEAIVNLSRDYSSSSLLLNTSFIYHSQVDLMQKLKYHAQTNRYMPNEIPPCYKLQNRDLHFILIG